MSDKSEKYIEFETILMKMSDVKFMQTMAFGNWLTMVSGLSPETTLEYVNEAIVNESIRRENAHGDDCNCPLCSKPID